jgi:beta-glucosidase
MVLEGSAEFRGELRASVTVTNAGSGVGREVVQLYRRPRQDHSCRRSSPLREEKALKPGESETLTFTLTTRDLASFDEASSSWRAEAGTYTVTIGASSEDLRQTATFNKARDEKVDSVSTAVGAV